MTCRQRSPRPSARPLARRARRGGRPRGAPRRGCAWLRATRPPALAVSFQKTTRWVLCQATNLPTIFSIQFEKHLFCFELFKQLVSFHEQRRTPRARQPSSRVDWRRLKHSSREEAPQKRTVLRACHRGQDSETKSEKYTDIRQFIWDFPQFRQNSVKSSTISEQCN